MSPCLRSLSRRGATSLGIALVATLIAAGAARAATLAISSDPFTQATCKASNTTNHKTEVEPDTFANGSTIVSAFQVGRVYDGGADRKSTRLNSSHPSISYAVFCLKKKKQKNT